MDCITPLLWYGDFGITAYVLNRDWLTEEKTTVNQLQASRRRSLCRLTLDQEELPTLSKSRLLRSSVGNENTIRGTKRVSATMRTSF